MILKVLAAGIVLVSSSCSMHDEFVPMYPSDCDTFKDFQLCRDKPEPAGWFELILIHAELERMN